MPLNILFSIFQTTNHSNGGVSSITQIIENDNSIQPIIITNRVGPFNNCWIKHGWKVVVSHIKWGGADEKLGTLHKLNDLFKSNLAAFKILKANKITVLYCNDIQGFWISYFGGKLAGAKIIFNLRDTKSGTELSSLKKWRFVAKKADVIIVLSQEMKDFVVNQLLLGEQSNKVFITYSIVKREIFHPVSKEVIYSSRLRRNISPDDFVISYVGVFSDKKAQLPFIENIVSKFKDVAGLKFYFVGDFEPEQNSYAKACEELVSKLGLDDKVKFIGHVDDIDQWYKLSNLVALGSLKEGLARCMIESISCGTPVISFDVCSAKEILLGYHCGEVAEMGNYADYISKINYLSLNNQVVQQYGVNGAEVSKQLFSKEKVISKYKDIYNAL